MPRREPCPAATVRSATVLVSPPRRIVKRTSVPTGLPRIRRETSSGERTRAPSTARITSRGARFPAAGRPCSTEKTRAPVATGGTFGPSVRTATAAAFCCESRISLCSSWRCFPSFSPAGTTAEAG